MLSSFLLSFTLLFFVPLQIYLTNILEFDFQFPSLLLFLVFLALAASLLITILLMLIPDCFLLKKRAQAFVFTMGFLVWLQSNILVWRYGPLDGRQILWKEKLVFGLLDGAIWLTLLALTQIKLAFFSRFFKPLSWALILLQLLTGFYTYSTSPPFPSFGKFYFSKTRQFDFSSQKNVIIILVDCFQSDVFWEVVNEDESLKQIFSGFTYFRNNVGGFPVTYASVPLILTGKYYDNTMPIQSFIKSAFQSPSSLPLVLTRNGVDVDLFPAARKVVYADSSMVSNVISKEPYPFLLSEFGLFMDISFFRSLPHFFKRFVYNEQKWFLKNLLPKKPFYFFKTNSPEPAPKKNVPPQEQTRNVIPGQKTVNESWQAKAGALFPQNSLKIPDVNFVSRAIQLFSTERQKPVFKFYHLMGVHTPLRMNENLEPELLVPTRPNWKRLVRGELKLIKIFFSLLADHGVYDNSLIIVMGDHGHPRGDFGRVLPANIAKVEAYSNRMIPGVIESGTPLLLAKQFNARGNLKISDAPVSIADIAKTVFSELRIPADCPGESIFHVAETAIRPRLFYFYTWTINDWKTPYLPPFFEYLVNGHCWLSRSWRSTGRILRQP